MRRGVHLAFGTALLASGGAAAQEPFTYLPAGDLIEGSGKGVAESTVFAPGMRYPVEVGPSYPNSQVYMNGGSNGPGGGQCDAVNYSYPWRDNYCETRSWDMPLCPAGTGHQGQDIRAPTCEDKKYWVVAATAGAVTNIGSYSIYVTTATGQRFDYLHGALDTVNVTDGQQVKAADPLVKLSNNMGDTPTTIHLHFNIKQDVAGVGFVYVSPYMSLVEAYKSLMGLGDEPPTGVFDQTGCDRLYGWAQDPDAPEAGVAVDLYFGGPKGDPAAVPVQVLANLPRPDLCAQLGSCDHGFEVDVPVSLRDGQPHPIHAYAVDSGVGEGAELELSPGQIECAAPPIPAGVRRWIVDPESLAAWKLSPFWQAIQTGDPELEAIPQSRDLGDAPVLARSDADLPRVWLIDQGFRRLVPDPETAAAWGFVLETVDIWPAADIQALPEAAPLRPRPILVQGTGPKIYLLDDVLCDPEAAASDPLCAEPMSTGTGGANETGGESPGTSTRGLSGAVSESSGEGDAGAALADEGCGCRSSAAPGLVGVGLVLAGLRRRRRG